jgi:pimeloyl-ACP methyl ester carboxylesterase
MATISSLTRAEHRLSHQPKLCKQLLRRGEIEYLIAGSGPAVLALHGSPGGSDQTLFFYRHLIDQGFTLVAPSRPGFMGTAVTIGETLAEQAESMVELLNQLGIKDFFISGYSCGAVTSVRIAAQYPQRVKGVVLESPVSLPFVHGCIRGMHGKLLLSDFGSFILKQLMTYAPHYSIRRVLDRESTYDERRLKHEARRIFENPQTRENALATLTHCMPARRRVPGMKNDARQVANLDGADLHRVACPTLIMHGTCDGDVPISHAEHAAAKIRNSKLIPVPDANHLLCVSEHWLAVQEARHNFFSAIVSGKKDPFPNICFS